MYTITNIIINIYILNNILYISIILHKCLPMNINIYMDISLYNIFNNVYIFWILLLENSKYFLCLKNKMLSLWYCDLTSDYLQMCNTSCLLCFLSRNLAHRVKNQQNMQFQLTVEAVTLISL